uniref:Transmembrane protein n=1 Tax=Ulva expansa TaxID=2293988 RepID=A0A3G2WHB5_9CHLO|nr:hypothetical protein [Ulva expansa]AYO97760.1 hypothetical protein [Ulva expansa]AYP41038.1 hypothetical protein [Ulva expansa]
MSMVTTILLEICYRNFYIACVFILMQCFSYFTQGFQLEYFSGLFVTNVQAVDFNFYSDINHNCKQNHQTEQQLSGTAIIRHQHDNLSVYSDKMGNHRSFVACDYQPTVDHFIALSSNEAKTWSCLFIVYLNYFYCIQLNQAALNFLLLYTKLEYWAVFIIINYYSNVKPGLFNKQQFWFFQTILGITLALFVFVLNQYTILTAIAIFEEFQLEQLDSELI